MGASQAGSLPPPPPAGVTPVSLPHKPAGDIIAFWPDRMQYVNLELRKGGSYTESLLPARCLVRLWEIESGLSSWPQAAVCQGLPFPKSPARPHFLSRFCRSFPPPPPSPPHQLGYVHVSRTKKPRSIYTQPGGRSGISDGAARRERDTPWPFVAFPCFPFVVDKGDLQCG